MEHIVATFFERKRKKVNIEHDLLEKFKEHIDSSFNPYQFNTLINTRGLLEYEFYIFCYEYMLNIFLSEFGKDYGKKVLKKISFQRFKELFNLFFNDLKVSQEEIYNKIINKNYK